MLYFEIQYGENRNRQTSIYGCINDVDNNKTKYYVNVVLHCLK